MQLIRAGEGAHLAVRQKTAVFIAFVIAYSCGGSTVNTSGPIVTYHMDRLNTNSDENILWIETTAASGYSYQISGTGFTSDVALETETPLQEKTLLRYHEEGLYTLTLNIKTKEGHVFIADTLSWHYSLEPPPSPIITFSEKATSDATVIMLLASSLGQDTVDLWVEGDLAPPDTEGLWITIPSSLQVPLTVSDGDGLKSFRVKYRNIFGNESALVPVEILKKSQGPLNCTVQASGSIVASTILRLHIAAENDGELTYSILGDLAEPHGFNKFTDATTTSVTLSPTPGVKNLTIKMHDLAANYCPDLELTVTYDPTYIPYATTIKNNPLWTDSLTITLVNSFDFLPGDEAQMFISGGVTASAKTLQWVAYEPELTIALAPVEGNRFVFTKFRYNADSEGTTLENHIYLKPNITITASGSPRSITISKIVDLTSLTITGCGEAYNSVAYDEAFACTPLGSEVTVAYLLNDGTTITRTTTVPL